MVIEDICIVKPRVDALKGRQVFSKVMRCTDTATYAYLLTLVQSCNTNGVQSVQIRGYSVSEKYIYSKRSFLPFINRNELDSISNFWTCNPFGKKVSYRGHGDRRHGMVHCKSEYLVLLNQCPNASPNAWNFASNN